MRTIKIFLLTISLFTISCKSQKEIEPNFDMSANTEVNIRVNDNVRNAMEHITNSSVNINSNCDANKIRKYSVDFYFNVNQNTKELIIIQYFGNPCEKGDMNLSHLGEKLIIPIEKIGSIDAEDIFNTYVDRSNDDFGQLFINMEYKSNSMVNEHRELRGTNFYTSTLNQNYVILDIPKNNIEKLKKSIETLILEFRK
jgi:hypothetical protein